MMKTKVLVYCRDCDATAEVLADLDEERVDSSCGCCSQGTDRYYISVSSYSLPTGWVQRRNFYGGVFLCPEHKEGA